MYLRKLEENDAERMLQWMHDPWVVEFMGTDFSTKTIEECRNFILSAQDESADLHLAVASDDDTYMGTVSLKHIDYDNKNAEFAITVCREAMGQGYANFAMKEILQKGINEIGLSEIYWCVSKLNLRAVRFYDKNNYKRVLEVPENIYNHYSEEQNNVFIWYVYKENTKEIGTDDEKI